MIIEKARDKILKEMLDRLPGDYDKSEGGLFYDNLAPVSIEMESLLVKLGYIFKNSFAETATGIYLDYIAKEVGVFRRQATKSRGNVTIKGREGAIVPLGTQVASDSYIYVITEEGIIGEEGKITLPIESQEPGSTYNIPAFTINNFPVTIQGLQEVINQDPTVDGNDIESDDELRERYYFKVQSPVTSGNVFHYKKWCLEVRGVGGVKVFPLWNGAGTVKCVIANSEIGVAPEELLERVRKYLEDVRPIGADVTVQSAVSKDISIVGVVTLTQNIDLEFVKFEYKKAVNKYLQAIGFVSNYVSYAKLGNILLNIPGVQDYRDLKVNGGVINVNLAVEEIPSLLDIALTEEGGV